MKSRLEWTQASLVAALIAAAALLFLELYNREIDAEGFNAYRQENLLWNATQLRFETMRFVDALGELRLAHDAGAHERMVERFDILWSRVSIVNAGQVGLRMRAIEGAEVVAALQKLLEAHESLVMSHDAASDAVIGQIADDFRRLLGPIQNYTAQVANFEEERMGAVQLAILESNRIGLWKTAAAIVLAAGLLATALIQVKADRRKLEEQRLLTLRAEEGAEAKRRFLTMMSHELRTPMNGVIGMLSLLDRSELDRKQRALTGVATRSAVEMLGLVEDILDLSDLQSGERPPEPEVASLAELALDLREAVGRRLCRADHGVQVAAVGEAGARLWIEREVALKALRQIAVFFVDRLALRETHITLSHVDDKLVVTIAASHEGPLRWQPEAFLGALTDADCAIQTEAIGVSVARGLVRLMHGEIVLDCAEGGRLVVVVRAPAPSIEMFVADAEPSPDAAALRAAG